MSSSEARWVMRWKTRMSAKALRPGIWRLQQGGFYLRLRVTEPRTGREVERTMTLRDPTMTVAAAQRALDQLRQEGRAEVRGIKPQRMRWCDFALSLFETKMAERRLNSASSQARWHDALKLLIPVFGSYYVDELRYAHLAEWRDTLTKWRANGMPSRRKLREAEEKKKHGEAENGEEDAIPLIPLSPATANGWMSIMRVICRAMTRRFELGKDPSEALESFSVERSYSHEQPNTCTPAEAQQFLTTMKAHHPEHYAMTFLGFVIGARPSTLRPLRRSGATPDILWDEGILLLRRSNSRGQAIMDNTKTSLDQLIPLPEALMQVLREHVAALPPGPMRNSQFLFPSTTGGMRSRSALDKPFRDVRKRLGWTLHLTPRGMRRTFQDLARQSNVHNTVTRAISGHQTERMHLHYSTASSDEMRAAVGRLVGSVTQAANDISEHGGDGNGANLMLPFIT